VIGGLTEATAKSVPYEKDRLTPIFGLGLRYRFSDRHSLTIDIERVQRWADAQHIFDGSVFQLSREPLTEPVRINSTFYPITLAYQLDVLSTARGRIHPYVVAGANLIRINGRGAPPQSYPNLVASTAEEIVRDRESDTWKFGLVAGIGCGTQVNTWLTVSGILNIRYKGLKSSVNASTGRADTQQNINGIVSEGTYFDVSPTKFRDSAFEGRLILEFRL
jgi:hypothetical protein